MGQSGNMSIPPYLGSLYTEKQLNILDFTNFTAVHFVAIVKP